MNSYCLIRYMRVYASPWLQQNWHDKEVWSHLGDWRSVRLSVLKCFGKHSFCYFLFYFVGIVYHITLSLIVSTTVLIVVSFILWFSSTLYCHSSFDCGVTLRNIIHIHYIITSDVNIDTNIHITSHHITSYQVLLTQASEPREWFTRSDCSAWRARVHSSTVKTACKSHGERTHTYVHTHTISIHTHIHTWTDKWANAHTVSKHCVGGTKKNQIE
jgi:hypothetical protein